jgi:hypothetical protein
MSVLTNHSYTKNIQSTIPPATRQNALVIQRPTATHHKLGMRVVNIHELRPASGGYSIPTVKVHENEKTSTSTTLTLGTSYRSSR